MIKITILKNNVMSNQAEFSSQEEADAWFERHKSMGSFGKEAYSYDHKNELTPPEYETQTELVSEAIYETQSVLITPAVIDEETNEEITPAVYEDQQVLIQEAIYRDIQVEIVPGTYETVTIDVPAEYEMVQEDTTAAQDKLDMIKEKQSRGRDARLACESVLDLIAGFNLDRELTADQITEMQTLFSNPEKALRASRPTTAKYLINIITPDDILVTQEMKDLCIELLSAY